MYSRLTLVTWKMWGRHDLVKNMLMRPNDALYRALQSTSRNFGDVQLNKFRFFSRQCSKSNTTFKLLKLYDFEIDFEGNVHKLNLSLHLINIFLSSTCFFGLILPLTRSHNYFSYQFINAAWWGRQMRTLIYVDRHIFRYDFNFTSTQFSLMSSSRLMQKYIWRRTKLWVMLSKFLYKWFLQQLPVLFKIWMIPRTHWQMIGLFLIPWCWHFLII